MDTFLGQTNFTSNQRRSPSGSHRQGGRPPQGKSDQKSSRVDARKEAQVNTAIRANKTWASWLHHFTHTSIRQPSPEPNNHGSAIRTSALFLGKRVAGAPESIITADLKPGAKYTSQFVAVRGEGKKYRYSFTAPPEGEDTGRSLFALVPE